LWILKSGNPVATDSTFSLAWRNVYQLPNDFDASKFKIQVKLTPQSGDSTDRAGSVLFSSILGLTDNTGTPYSTDKSIFDNDTRLLVIPPYRVDNAVLSNRPFANPALNDPSHPNNSNPGIYTMTQDSLSELKPKFSITMSGSSKKSQFQLGSGNIMDKSEKVKGQDGEELVRDKDYTLDYQFGSLNLISKNALSKTRIDVEYQSEAAFIPKSKVFLGLHGQMNLPFGVKSFIGASILYQNAAGQALIPKIGQEPYSKVLLDANTHMEFEPQWMTMLMNQIPLLTTEDKSTASIEVEVANSRTNPNTDGQAYIDDFESSNRSFDLGLDGASWYQAAPPGYLLDSLLHHPPAWTQFWYQPLSYTAGAHDVRVLKDSLFYKIPAKHTYTTDDNYEPVLNFECLPAPTPNSAAGDSDYGQWYSNNNLNPWAGIMFPIPSNSMNRTKDKFLEFYARGSGGRLYIDMGEVSEDICFLGGAPNHRAGNEDTTNTGTAAFNVALDVGLDGLPDKLEYYQVPNKSATGWDTLRYGCNWLPYKFDPAKDNFHLYSTTNTADPEQATYYPFVNGKELNGQYDSKDLMGDGLSTTENYFRRFIDFDSVNQNKDFSVNAYNYKVLPDSSLGNTKVKNGWHLYRIPLNDTLVGKFSKTGFPRWDQIRFIRLFWTDFNPKTRTTAQRIQFARVRLVRNEWQEQPIRQADSSNVVKLSVSTINTEDNPEYVPPPGFSRVTDESGNIVKESALKLDFNNILPGDTALVKNILVNQTLNLSTYTTMSMVVYGDPLLGQRDDFYFFFRFGNDDSTYYEYRAPLYPKWDAHNTMNINLHEFSLWKQRIMGDNPPIRKDTSFLSPNGNYSYAIKYHNNQPPNFAGISWMAMGVTRSGAKNSAADGYNGELWVDELKVSGVHSFNGWATRAALNSSWAGFMTLNGDVEYTGADFQQMTNTTMTLGNTSLNGGLHANWALNKFLPAQWGVNIPLGTSVSSSITRPTLVSNTDVFLTDPKTNIADGFMDMYKDYINLLVGKNIWDNQKTEAEHYQTSSASRSFLTGFEKATTSKNPLVNMLLERLSLDYNYNFNLTQTSRGRRSNDESRDYIDSVQTDRYAGSIKYDLSPKPAPAWTKWKPFENAKLSLLPERFKNYEFSLLPTTMNFTLAEIVYSKTKSVKDNPPELGGSTVIATKNLTLMHNATIAYDPLSILKLNYTLTINRTLDNDLNNPPLSLLNSSTQWQKLLKTKIASLDPTWGKYLVLADERDRAQNMAFNFDPTLWDWFTWSFEYSSNYKQNAATLQNDATNYLNLGLTSTFHLTSTLTIATLFKKFSEGLSNHKAMAAVFGSIEKALTKLSLNSFSFNYNAAMSLTNNYWDEPYLQSRGVSRADFLKYQVGLSGRNAWDIVTANMNDRAFGGMRYRQGYQSPQAPQENDNDDRRTSDRSLSLSTSFALPDPIPVTINNVSIKYSRSYSVQPNPLYRDSTTTFPEIDVGAGSQILNKIKLVTRYLQNVSLNSSYNYQKKIQNSHTPSIDDTITSTSMRFAPLFGIDGKLKKWPVNVSYSMTYNSTTNDSKKNGTTDNSEYINKMTLSYEIQKSNDVSEFKLLLWTIPLKGTFTVGVDGEQGSTQSTQSSFATGSQPTEQSTSHWSFGPHSSYTFSDNITGNLSFSASQNKKESVTQTSYIFKLSVNIALK
jgi:cell surface protein SprA